jgi:predicted  nucleic acid-binding Zn-ribbon protein
MVNNTDGNTYAIDRHLEEREQYDMENDMQDEIDTLHDEADRLKSRIKKIEYQRDKLISALHDEVEGLEGRITKIESHRDRLISALRHDIVTMETSAIRKPHLVRRAALSRAAIAECEADQ